MQRIDVNSKKRFNSVQEIIESEVIPLSRKNETIIWNFVQDYLDEDDVKIYLQNYIFYWLYR